MAIELRPITRDNFRDCIGLSVGAAQKDFVATNVVSIAQAYVEPAFVPRAIYEDDTLVGFVMYGRDEETGVDWVIRLMIDERYQGRGYGRAALLAVIALLKQLPASRGIKISYVPENHGAARLYAQVGFRPTGEVDDGEIVALLDLDS